jgi:molecular chaperone DnaK
VKGRDRATGREQEITVTADGALPAQEIERMKTEAKQFSQLDSQRRQEIRARNEADTCIHLAEETLRQHRDQLSAEVAEVVERQIGALRAALQGGNVIRIATARRELQGILAEIMDQTAEPSPEADRMPRALTRLSRVPHPRDAPDELAESA